jgi:hypothetical protein
LESVLAETLSPQWFQPKQYKQYKKTAITEKLKYLKNKMYPSDTLLLLINSLLSSLKTTTVFFSNNVQTHQKEITGTLLGNLEGDIFDCHGRASTFLILEMYC